MIKSKIIFGLLALFLLGGTVIPALGQTDAIADHVVINEIDINPPGDDSKSISEWIELYNPTSSSIDIGGWSIASTTLLKKTLKISDGTIIKPDSYLLFNHQALWFPDVAEVVELRDKAGNVVDKTPKFTDLKNDYTSWQRIYDGYDTDSDADWVFELGNRGMSNGKMSIEETKSSVTVSITTDKENYIFGDVATITGKVSERMFVEKPYFQAAQIKVNIEGPNFFSKTITLFPDQNLSFKTTINLSKVLGFNGGEYTATVKYADGSASTKFSLGTQVVQVEEKEPGSLSITTEKEAYLPGQFVTIKASTTDVIPLEGLKYKVINPEKQTVASGSLYPNAKGEFTGSVFMSTVKPVYGAYRITAEYSTYYTESTFDLVADLKDAKLITLKTDKTSYKPGEKVTVTGRLNTSWIPAFDIEVLQIGSQVSAKEIRQGALIGNIQNQFRILNVARLAGDSTFSYEFTIPSGSERLGNYIVTVSKDVGSEQVFFKVTDKEEDVAVSTEPFTLSTDKKSYDIGEKLVIFGNIFKLKVSSTFQNPSVSIIFKDPNGKDVTFLGCTQAGGSGGKKGICNEPTKLTLTSVPNVVGDFRSEVTISNELFKPGQYTVKASYDQGRYTTSASFLINDLSAIGVNDIIVSLDKKVYGLGEKIQLTGKVSERFPEKTLAISLTKPNGDTERHGVVISNQAFSWSWITPSSENLAAQVGNERSLASSNFGTYKIKVSSEREETNVFFRVSPNPDEDFVLDVPFVIKTNKAVYDAGEKLVVSGKTTKRPQATAGLIPERIQILVKSPQGKVIYESSVHPDVSGDFKQTFEMPVTVFKDGTYRVSGSYFDLYDEMFFVVNNNFVVGGDEPLALKMELDKEVYYPGDVVKATGRLNKLIFLEHFELTVLKEDPSTATCGAFYCGKGVPVVTVKPDKAGTFTYEFKIPNLPTSLGGYLITADTDFGSVSKIFTVVEKPATSIPVETEKPVETETPAKKFFEKENRITESSIPITVSEKTINDQTVQPRSIDGSLLTTKRGDEASVNIQVTTESGTCVIGPDTSCLVSESTRAPGTIYKIVEVDGISYKIRYSGPDARLEKFTILPDLTGTTMPDSTWNVEILKGDEPSRFYYKVAYLPAA
ncbi:MAG: lamin tail domain-containing protein [Nitrosopumilaceae archaeon]